MTAPPGTAHEEEAIPPFAGDAWQIRRLNSEMNTTSRAGTAAALCCAAPANAGAVG